tara:strand:- start:13342 stop:14553 length:1212 start_codon:yes stop_codon:yes gene_type:complete
MEVSKLQKDIEDIQSIAIVPTILDVVCRATGMGFAAIARVTEDTWLTCGVLDNIPFGLSVGDELEISTTFCKRVRESNELVVIDHVEKDEVYFNHPIPLQYGFQSYISVPIVRNNGEFFGTLCALDPKPNKLKNAKVIDMFTMFSQLISFHLDAVKTMRSQANIIKHKEGELATYDFISSHDLQEPLRKIEILSNTIETREGQKLTLKGRKYFKSIRKAATQMRNILDDLLKYSENDFNPKSFQVQDMQKLVEQVRFRLSEEFDRSNATLTMGTLHPLQVMPVQMEQLFYNLFSNSLRYRDRKRKLVIEVESRTGPGSNFKVDDLDKNLHYCEITVRDNGKGFDQQYNEKIFEIFQRLENKQDDKSTGIGLAIVKRIVANHNGRIMATSEPNSHATFKIYLPI